MNTRHKPTRVHLATFPSKAFSIAHPVRFVFSSLFRMLSLTIPAHPRNAPVSPMIPAHTQKQGVGGTPNQMCSLFNPFVFFGCVNYSVTYNCRWADIFLFAPERGQTQEPVPQSGTGHYIRERADRFPPSAGRQKTAPTQEREKQIPPLRGPTRHNSARKKKSGRSGRDDGFCVEL